MADAQSTTLVTRRERCASRYWYVALLYFLIITDTQHAPGEDEWGYEDAGERWLPVHTVETVVRVGSRMDAHTQLISVISLLSADHPDLNSPANVDAAKEVREDYPCQ